ncbi:hypothetical protein HDV02_001765 [Globomyces sp. JEL0801]|nr:hypothetical protein HDV02_001765 [Globomyces sp. JEL0801]
MSKLKRQERLQQLEKERQHFYRNSQIQLKDEEESGVEDYYLPESLKKSSNDYPEYDRNDRGGFQKETVSNAFERAANSGYKSHIDQFEKMVLKDKKTRAKYHVSDKTLLEDERARNAVLEQSYEKLLLQVQNLQNTHLQDLRNSEQRFHSASSALQKALVSKSEELIEMSNKLASSQARYERESRNWAKERVSLASQVDTLSTTNSETLSKLSDRERRLGELNKLRKELAERIAGREQDLLKYGKALREREGDYTNEKETRIKLEGKLMKTEKDLEKSQNENHELQNQLQRKNIELEELSNVKLTLIELKRDHEDLTRKEKHYLQEIEQMSTRERKLYHQVEDLVNQDRKSNLEITKLNDRQNQLLKEIDDFKKLENKLRQDLANSLQEGALQEAEIVKVDKQARQYQQDTTRLLQEISTIQTQLHEVKLNNQNISKELQSVKANEDQLLKEKESLLSRISLFQMENQNKQVEIETYRQQVKDIGSQLQLESQQYSDMRSQNKEKFILVSNKIAELQDTLSDTQKQLADLQANEKVIRNTLKQREDTIRNQNAMILEADNRIQEMLANSSKDAVDLENYKNKKRDEILAIQDKYHSAKQAMDNEIAQLKLQFQQKQGNLSSCLEEISHLKAELLDMNDIKQSLEAKIQDLLISDGNLQRQVASLTSSLNQKIAEVNRLANRHMSLVDQTKRQDEELQMYRDNTTVARDADITRLQTNMEEISKRLKTQVDVLLDGSNEHSRVSSTNNGSNASPVRTRFSLSPSLTSAASPRLTSQGLTRSGDKHGEEEFDIERMFSRNTSTKRVELS